MFKRAANIRIPTAVSFYVLTALMSVALLSVLRVNHIAFCFGVATSLFAHAAVYFLLRDYFPRWVTLYILALVVPWFPPEALTTSERGALYWGILAGLLAYTLAYGAHYGLRLGRGESEQGAEDERKKRPDRHASELFRLLEVNNFSQSLKAVRKLLEDHERREDAPAKDAADSSLVAVLQEKLSESQSRLKQLRKQLNDSERLDERRQMQQKIEEAERRIHETSVARDIAEGKAQSLQGFQLRVAELTQQLSSLRSESGQNEDLLKQLRADLDSAEAARDTARSECERLAGELARLRAAIRPGQTDGGSADVDQQGLKSELAKVNLRLQQSESERDVLCEKLHGTETALTATRRVVKSLNQNVERLESQLQARPDEREQQKNLIARLETEQKRNAAEMESMRNEIIGKSQEIKRANDHIAGLQSAADRHQAELEMARKRIAELKDDLAFHQQTVEELTPEIDRLDGIIKRYEEVHGPPPPRD